MTRAWHDPYDARFRSPEGAIPAQTDFTVRIVVYGECERVFVRVWRSGCAEWTQMHMTGINEYSASIYSGDMTGLLWYCFAIDSSDGRVFGGKPENGACDMFSSEPASFQITVCDPSFDTPKWMRSSIMYQIMPDRFYIGGKARQPHGRGAYLHNDWYEQPHLRRKSADGDGESIDFFGGNLRGIYEKLKYIKSLGIGALYLNPIFEARSNHKYDVGDYSKIDTSFGDDKDFQNLSKAAADAGISLVLDGVFSHTGADSIYFNKFGTYGAHGAYNDKNSEYRKWYSFDENGDYDCWWGIETLPNVNELDESFLKYIVTGDKAIIARYLALGANGWRLDVADELPMRFIELLRRRVKSEGLQNAVIGEVWDDISNKIAYGALRSYALGDTLDSAMNYPLRTHLLGFLLGKNDAYTLAETIKHQKATLPKSMYYSMMNLLGSHDKPRIISVLSGRENLEPPRDERRYEVLSSAEYALGKRRFTDAWRFVCHLPGMPCMYYGDEVGMTGMADPFCRAAYPWGREDAELLDEIKEINALRNSSSALKTGECEVFAKNADEIEVVRTISGGTDAFGEKANDERITFTLKR